MELHAFPKIFTIGQDYIRDLFLDPVEITEKIDGSQFVMAKIDGQLYMRSKGKQIFSEDPEKMFAEAIDYCVQSQTLFRDGLTYFCEYLKKPKHNVLAYARTPHNHLALFGISNQSGRFIYLHEEMADHAQRIGIEIVRCLYKGMVDDAGKLSFLLQEESALGGTKIEGFVAKNYFRPFLLGGQPIPLMMGKYVSEAFKERSKHDWKGEHTGKGKWKTFCEGFRTEARWRKAVQHLAESGELLRAPQDIGPLLAEIKRDITEEEKDYILSFLWKEFGNDVLRRAVAGAPEWYKQKLLDGAFNA